LCAQNWLKIKTYVTIRGKIVFKEQNKFLGGAIGPQAPCGYDPVVMYTIQLGS